MPDTQPLINLFQQLLTIGAALGAVVCAFFLMLGGYQWMTAGGSVRAAESAKSSIYHALIGFAVVIPVQGHRQPGRQRPGRAGGHLSRRAAPPTPGPVPLTRRSACPASMRCPPT